MSGPKISITADNSQVLSALEEIKKHSLKISDTLNNKSSSPFDLESAKADLKQLETLVQSYSAKMSQASKSGNLSGLDVDDMTSSLKQAVSVGDDLNSVLKALNAGVDSTGMSKAVREQERVSKFNQRAVKDMETMTRERMKFARGTKDVADVEERLSKLRAAGTRGTGRVGKDGKSAVDYLSDGGGWQEYSLDKKTNERHRNELADALGVSLDGGNGGGGIRGFMAKHSDRMQAVAGATIAGGMTGGAGGAGIGSILGMAASFLPGGKFLAPILGAAGGAVGAAIEPAIAEGSTYSELRRAVGASVTEFDLLRDSVRASVDGLGLTYTESANLASQFARTAGVLSDGTSKIGSQVGDAAGFGRSYGVGADSSTQFFAQMRLLRASSGDQDNRRLALMIADSVQSGGTSSKMDEVLSVVSSFTSSVTRASYSTADVGGYSDLLAKLTGSGTPGLAGSPAAAGELLGRVDASIRSGGSFGDASRAFNLASLQRYGVTGYDVDYFNETGILGTPRQALASMERFAMSAPAGPGRDRKMGEIEGMRSRFGRSLDEDNLTRMLREGEAYSGGNIDELGEWGSRHTGLTKTEFQAFYSSMKRSGGVSGASARLSDAGIDLSSLNMRSLQELVELSSEDDAGIRSQGSRLQKKGMPVSDKWSLNQAMLSGNAEELRNTVLRLTNAYSGTDAGEEAKIAQADMANSLALLATHLIPLTTDIREGINSMVRVIAPDARLPLTNEEAKVRQEKFDQTMNAIFGTALPAASSRSSGAFSVLPFVDKTVLNGGSQISNSVQRDFSQHITGRFELWERGAPIANPLIIDTEVRPMQWQGGAQ